MEKTTYHSITTVFNRDPKTNYKTVIDGEFATEEFEYLANQQWEFTEKIDGTNIRVFWDGKVVNYGGKTDNAQIPVNLLNSLSYTFDIDERIGDNIPPDTVLYGEGYGAGIQKGGKNYISNGVGFILFDVRVGEIWLKRKDVYDIANKLRIERVPTLKIGTLYEAVDMAKNGFDSLVGKKCLAEGIVMRPMVELFNRRGSRIITKIKTRDFNSSQK